MTQEQTPQPRQRWTVWISPLLLGALVLLLGLVLLRSRDANNDAKVEATATTTATQAPTATQTATTAPTPATADAAGKCQTNSPNIPCINAQAKTAGFNAFTVNGKLIGGPAEQWWPLQQADGNFVPNSYKMVGMRQNDKGSLPGYEMHVPEGMILDTWLDGPEFNNRKTAARIYGPANINANYRVAEATLYAAPSDFVKDLAGMWARLTDKYECGDFAKAGTTPPAATSPHDCHVATKK